MPHLPEGYREADPAVLELQASDSSTLHTTAPAPVALALISVTAILSFFVIVLKQPSGLWKFCYIIVYSLWFITSSLHGK